MDLAGYEAVCALDASAAIARLMADHFDLVISDIRMPTMSGLELLTVVRHYDMDVPVILMTAAPDIEGAARAVELGAFRYLTKPIDKVKLIESVERAVLLNRLARTKREAATVTGASAAPGERIALEVAFEKALEKLWVAFQPIVAIGARDVYGYEALMRSDEPTLPNPGVILDAAERLDRTNEVGRRMRKLTAEKFRGASPHALCFVNMHPRDLLDPELYEDREPLRPIARRVVLEITERSRLADIDDVSRRVARLRSFGFRIAIDDLGAGYAGLSTFALLEPELVKIDMSLVRDIDTSPIKSRLVANLGSLCRDIGIDVVAEGVETAAERDRLVGLGFDLFQGYLFARPGKPFPAVTF